MAKIKSINGKQLVIRFETAPGSNVFEEKCTINTARGIQWASSVTESIVPDCDDLQAPGWVEIDIDGLNGTITGNGMFNTPDRGFFWDWYVSGDPINVQVAFLDVPTVDGGGYWQGAAKITGFNVTGSLRNDRVTFESVIRTHDEWTWVDV